MRLDVSAVDRRAPSHRARCRQGIEQAHPEAPAKPTVEAIVDRRRRAIIRRAIAPSASRLQDMDDPGDHAPVINTPRTRLVPGQMRLYRRPLGVRKPKQVGHSCLQSPD